MRTEESHGAAPRPEEAASPRHAVHLALLARTSQRLLEDDGGRPEVLGRLFQGLSAALGFDLFFHYRCGRAADELKLVASGGLSAEQTAALSTIRRGQYLCGLVAERRTPLVIHDLHDSGLAAAAELRDAGARCYVGIPLLAGQTLVGTASFASRQHPLIEDDALQLIQAVCDQAAVAVLRGLNEARLRRAEERNRQLLDNADQGYCLVELIDDADGQAVDYRFLEVNRAFARHTGLTDVVGRTARELVPDLEQSWVATYDKVARTGVTMRFEQGSLAMGRLFDVDAVSAGTDPEGGGRRVALLFSDITARRTAEDRLRESERRFRHLADHAPMMVWVTEADGSCSFLSKSWRDFTGQTPEEGLGTGWLRAVHPQDAAAAEATFLQANARGEPFSLEYRLRNAAGTYRWALDSAVPRRADDGSFLGYIGSVIDIDERRAAEERQRDSEARLRLALEAAATGMWEWDLGSDAVTWSPECYLIHGVAPDSFGGTAEAFGRLVHPDDAARVWRAVRAAAADGSRYACEFRIVRPDGEVRWVANLGRAVKGAGGRFDRVVGTITDITARKRADEALKLADRRKDEFLAMLAHELRNPLAPIRSSVAVLRARRTDDAVVDRCHDVIDRQVTQMARLLDDLLDVSRVSSGKVALRRAPATLRSVLDAAIETSRPALDQKHVELAVHDEAPDLVLDCDASRLTQVFANLLNNAAKYGRPAGHVNVTLRREPPHAVVTVEDDGIGIAPELIEQVFEIFVQAPEARDHAPEGLGIGLSLAHRLVGLHGGTIRAASPGRGLGSRFTVRLPL
jgi:PAS domain S-box-containing protein